MLGKLHVDPGAASDKVSFLCPPCVRTSQAYREGCPLDKKFNGRDIQKPGEFMQRICLIGLKEPGQITSKPQAAYTAFYFSHLSRTLACAVAIFIALLGTASAQSPAWQETATGWSGNSTSVSTSSNMSAVTSQLYLAAVSTKPNVSVTSVTGLGLTWTVVGAQCG